jgi:hypothetical protein
MCLLQHSVGFTYTCTHAYINLKFPAPRLFDKVKKIFNAMFLVSIQNAMDNEVAAKVKVFFDTSSL